MPNFVTVTLLGVSGDGFSHTEWLGHYESRPESRVSIPQKCWSNMVELDHSPKAGGWRKGMRASTGIAADKAFSISNEDVCGDSAKKNFK